MRKAFFCFGFLLAAFFSRPANAQTQTGQLGLMKASWELDKKLVLAELMQFDKEEASIFWPLYDKYMKDWCKLVNYRIYTIMNYSEDFKNMTALEAPEFAEELFDNDAKLTKLQKKTFKKVRKIIVGSRASQFMQLEYAFQLAFLSEIQQRVMIMGDLMKKL